MNPYEDKSGPPLINFNVKPKEVADESMMEQSIIIVDEKLKKLDNQEDVYGANAISNK
jgi:hypothetical protein